MNVERFDVIVAGMGGQGTILASRIIAKAGVLAGINVRGSELLGLSQRGGAVHSHIRFGNNVEAPTILEGTGDILLCFEPSEGLRHLRFLSPNGLILVNTNPIMPTTVLIGLSKYPELDHILAHYRKYTKTLAFDARELAMDASSAISVNVIMIGAMAGTGRFPIDTEMFINAIETTVSGNLVEPNKKAFNLGFQKAHQLLREDGGRLARGRYFEDETFLSQK